MQETASNFELPSCRMFVSHFLLLIVASLWKKRKEQSIAGLFCFVHSSAMLFGQKSGLFLVFFAFSLVGWWLSL